MVGNKLLQYTGIEEKIEEKVSEEDDDDFPVNSTNLIEDLYNYKMKEAILGDINTDSETHKEDSDEKVMSDNKEEVGLNFSNNSETQHNENTSSFTKLDKVEESTNLTDSEKMFEEMYKKTFGISPASKTVNNIEEKTKEESGYAVDKIDVNSAEPVTSFKNKMMYSPVKYKFIGIAFSSYIIIEIEDDIYIVDQKLANERIVFEKLKESYKNNQSQNSQQMLLPDIINVTNKQMDIVKDNILIFKKIGFDLDEFGELTIKLSGVPSMCMELDTKELFLDCLNQINTIARTSKQEIEDKIIEIIASKVAENNKTALTFEEVDTLMRKLLTVKNPFTSENEKGIAIKLTKAEIDKKFNK